MHLVLLAVGDNVHYHFQAIFSSLTFLRSPLIERVSIITDAKNLYRAVSYDARVGILVVDREILARWKGRHDFFWRIKIEAIAHAYAEMPGLDVLYVDTDTFLYDTLEEMKTGLDSGKPYMHLPECRLAEGGYKSARKMWKSLSGKTFLGYSINERTTMWNAGVVALPAREAKRYIDETLALCDTLTATPCERKLLEQLAFSMVLAREDRLEAADRIIGHYWGSKAVWEKEIQRFLLLRFMAGKSLEELIEETSGFDYFALPLKGGGQRKTALRLHRLVDRLIPRKAKTFFRDSNRSQAAHVLRTSPVTDERFDL